MRLRCHPTGRHWQLAAFTVKSTFSILIGLIHRDKAWREQYHRLKVEAPEAEPDYQFPPNLEVNKIMNTSWREYVRGPGLLRAISQLEIPALYVYGSKDNRPSWPVAQLAGLLPKGQFVLIEGAPHLIWTSHDVELGRELNLFLSSISYHF